LAKDTPLLFQLLEEFGLEAHSRPVNEGVEGAGGVSGVLFWRSLGPVTRTTTSPCYTVLTAGLTWETWTWVVAGPYTQQRARSTWGAQCIAMDLTYQMCLHASSLLMVRLGAYGGASSHGGTWPTRGNARCTRALVLAILLYSLQLRVLVCLRESELQELRSSHHDCVRTTHDVSHLDVAC
jgi:hypothetical protein